MKTIICLSALILLMNYSRAQNAQAQKPAPSITISAGISSAAYTTDDEYGKSYTSDLNTGFGGGITFRLPTGVHWAVEPGLFYIQKGGSENAYGVKVNTSLNYLEVPVNVYYSKRSRFFLSFGPTFGLGLSGNIKAEGESEKISFGSGDDDDLKSLEIGLDITAGYQFRNNFFISLTTAAGMSNLAVDDSYEYSNGYIGLRVGYVFSKKQKTE